MERIRIDRRKTGSRMRRMARAARHAEATAPLEHSTVDGGDTGGDTGEDVLARIDAVLTAADPSCQPTGQG